MDRLGLSVADFNVYVAHLRSPSIGVTIQARLLDMSGQVTETIPGVLGGTLNVDTTQANQAARQATIIMSDPGHTMDWDSNSPNSAAASVDRQIRLDHVTYVPALGRRVTCPLITGPIRGFSRSGTQVTTNVWGRDDLMFGQALHPHVYTKSELRTDALRDHLSRYGGNSNLNGVPTLTARLPAPLSVAKNTVPMVSANNLAKSMSRQLFFDGRGNPILRLIPAHPVITLYEGDQGVHTSDIIGEAQTSWNLAAGWFNVVEVTGDKPSVHAMVFPPPAHPMHPQNMGSNGAWNARLFQEQNPKIRTTSEATARAQQLLNQQLNQAVSVTAISKCLPFLQERDVIRMQLRSGVLWHSLEKFSIDLAGTGMSLGYNRRFHNAKAPRPIKRKDAA